MKKQYVWSNFNGGTASDLYVGQDGSFLDSANVDTHRSPSEAVLSFESTQKYGTNFGDTNGRYVIKMMNVGGDFAAFSEDGRIYKNGVFAFGPEYPASSGTDYSFEDAIVFGSYIYIAARKEGGTRFSIMRLSVSDFASGNWAAITPDWAYYDSTTFNTATYGSRLQIFNGSKLVVARNNRAWSIDQTPAAGAGGALDTIAPIAISLPIDNQITCVTQNSEYLRIYTREGYLYLWGCMNLAPDYRHFIGIPVFKGVSDMANDYVVTEEEVTRLYMVSGFQKSLIASTNTHEMGVTTMDFSQGNGNWRTWHNSICYHDGFVYIAEDKGIVAYGTRFNGVNPSIIRKFDHNGSVSGGDYVTSSTYTSAIFYSQRDGKLLYWSKIGATTNYKLFEVSASTQVNLATAGFIETRGLTLGKYGSAKNINELQVGCVIPDVGASIIVQCKIDSNAYRTIGAYNATSKGKFVISALEMVANNLVTDFNEIRFKLILNRSTISGLSPRLRDVTIIYNDSNYGS